MEVVAPSLLSVWLLGAYFNCFGGSQHNAEWQGWDDLTGYVTTALRSSKGIYQLFMKMTKVWYQSTCWYLKSIWKKFYSTRKSLKYRPVVRTLINKLVKYLHIFSKGLSKNCSCMKTAGHHIVGSTALVDNQKHNELNVIRKLLECLTELLFKVLSPCNGWKNSYL